MDMHAAVLHGIGQTPRYELFTAPVAGEDERVVTVSAAPLKPQVVGLDGVGRLEDGSRVAFMIPQRPYGGMAERTLVRRGMWLPVPDGSDDVTAFDSLARQVAAGEIVLDVKPVPLADVEKTWRPSDSDRRIVFVP